MTTSKEVRVGAYLCVSAIIIAALYLFTSPNLFGERVVDEKTTFLNSIKSEASISEIRPTESVHSLPIGLHDLEVDFASPSKISLSEFIKNPFVDQTSVRLKMKHIVNSGTLLIEIPKGIRNGSRGKLIDNYNRVLMDCLGSDCKSQSIQLESGTGLIKVTLSDFDDDTAINISGEKIEYSNSSSFELPTISISMDTLKYSQFRWLADAAKKPKLGSLLTTPNQKVVVKMACCSKDAGFSSVVNLGVSGRSGGHFDVFPPSMNIKIEKGKPILGMKSFKLIRPRLRHDMYEPVVASMLVDAGVKTPELILSKVLINGRFAGYFYIEETVSPTFFENQKMNENVIVGYDTKGFFGSNPAVLTEKHLYNPADKKRRLNESYLHDSFSAKLDWASLYKSAAILSLFMGTHGLGADDLKFAFDPIEQKYFAYPRDFKIGAWPLTATSVQQSFNSHFSFINLPHPFSSSAMSGFIGAKRSYGGATIGVWDIHPTVKAIGHKIELRRNFEKYLFSALQSNLNSQFKRRLRNFAAFIEKDLKDTAYGKKFEGANRFLDAARGQAGNADDVSHYSLAQVVNKMIETRKPLVVSGDRHYEIFNRLPFSISVNGKSNDCQQTQQISADTVLGPLLAVANDTVPLQTLNVIRFLKSALNEHHPSDTSPLCTLEKSQFRNKPIRISLPDGSETEFDVIEKQLLEQKLVETNTHHADLNDKVIAYPLDFFWDDQKAVIQYAVHFLGNYSWNGKLPTLHTLDKFGNPTPLATAETSHFKFNLRVGQPENLDNTTLFTSVMGNPYQYFDSKSKVFTFKVDRQTKNLNFAFRLQTLKEITESSNVSNLPQKTFNLWDSNAQIYGNYVPKLKNNHKKMLQNRDKTGEATYVETLLSIVDKAQNLAKRLEDTQEIERKDIIYPCVNLSTSSKISQKNRENLQIMKDRLQSYSGKAQDLIQNAAQSTGNIQFIDKSIHIKKNKTMIIPAGSTYLFAPGTSIEVEGQLIIQGEENLPTMLIGNPHFKGIRLKKGSKAHEFNNVLIANTTSDDSVYGGVSVSQTKLSVKNSTFLNLQTEDGINVSSGILEIENSLFAHSKSDLIDSDFSFGHLESNTLMYAGGDFIDMNQSNFVISSNQIMGAISNEVSEISDKALSCGEKSICTVRNNAIWHTNFGLVAKDSSRLIATENLFHSTSKPVASFIKKPWYSEPKTILLDNSTENGCVIEQNLGFFRY